MAPRLKSHNGVPLLLTVVFLLCLAILSFSSSLTQWQTTAAVQPKRESDEIVGEMLLRQQQLKQQRMTSTNDWTG